MAFNKYTKYCTQEGLINCINAQEKNEHETHILLNVFKKSLSWLQEQDRQMFEDAVSRLSIRNGRQISEEKLIFIFVINGLLWWNQMVVEASQFIRFEGDHSNVRYDDESTYAVLTDSDLKLIVSRDQMRQKESIRKFIKSYIFYPYYIEEESLKDFAYLIRTAKLRANEAVRWKDQDHSHKIGLVYRGVLSIQLNWKRNIQLCQITKGMFLTNNYIKDMIEQIADLEHEPIQQPVNQHILSYYSKLNYISKTDKTILLIFNLRLISEPPYNANPEIKLAIKRQYQKYLENLRKIIEFQESQKWHRSKMSIKQQLKRRKAKQAIQRDLSIKIKAKNIRSSPLLRAYATVQFDSQHSYSATRVDSLDIQLSSKPYSKLAFRSIPAVRLGLRSNAQHPKAKIAEQMKLNLGRAAIKNGLIHNTWVEASNSLNTKKGATKSFSTLTTFNFHRQQKDRFHKLMQEQQSKSRQPQFFVPDQFVRRKLKLKYQRLISKMKRLDLSVKNVESETIYQKMARLQQFVDSKRIVKMNVLNKKYRLLRDRVTY